ncbi:aa3-type cytochrome oxidase subunit IV [Microbacterium caowuchunii]|jgi:Cytochrome c oxidase subunit IV|uniref:Cytochrome c oxidase polypeptide 4 n=1 Tax=Microbacterium caowuchunii TaxID=2614638 RepID=A0A5N0TLB4_9MICO|nr:cytochrome c oxidase subunit 4 [Microbacterium caowuchunii]KAA9135890.1 cytochrome c oxidase subunit 4 [Microbacterium caowuchunii]
MRTNTNLWWILVVFFAFICVVYTGWNILAHPDLPWPNAIEWVGSIALLFGALMSAMIAFYTSRVHKAQGGELPEDTLTADIDDGDPELGEFSPWSWWPIVLAASAAVAVIGLAVGTWMVPIGFAIFAVAIVGWVFEYYRGYFAR